MIIKPRQCVLCKNHVATSKVKFTVHTYNLCIHLNEIYSCPAHNFVVGPASGMVRSKDLVFHPFVRSHQGAILLKTLSGDISVLWTHFFSSLICSGISVVLFHNLTVVECHITLFLPSPFL